MRYRVPVAVQVLSLLALTPGIAGAQASKLVVPNNSPLLMSQPVADADCGLKTDMRKLWEDHVTWTRVYVISAVAGLPDKDVAAKRLLQNQSDIGEAIKPYYGDDAGKKLTLLLRDHIVIATELIAAAKAGDAAKQADATHRWYANADDIAAFLGAANPGNWPEAEMRRMMHDHLDQTTAEVVARLHQDWDADVVAYDAIHVQAMKMADMLSSGIAAQFPSKVHGVSVIKP